MVSERHNQAYKETIKLFKPLEPDAPLNRVPIISLVPGPDDGVCNCDHLVHTTAEPLVTAEECNFIIDESEEWARRARHTLRARRRCCSRSATLQDRARRVLTRTS